MRTSTNRWVCSIVSKSPWITLAVMAAAFVMKSVLFRTGCGMDASLLPARMVAAYLSVAAAAVAMGSVVWWKRRWWTVVLCLATDIWLLAGVWYYRANGLLLSWGAVRTITELHGFEDSLLAYLRWSDVLYPLLSVIACGWVYVLPQVRVHRHEWLIAGIITGGLYLSGLTARLDAPFTLEERSRSFRAEENYFIRTHSPLAHFGLVLCNGAKEVFSEWSAMRPLTDKENELLRTVHHDSAPQNAPEGHLVYILVESFETWALEATDSENRPVCPCMTRYIKTHPVLYVPHVETQQRYGRSGDGQLITQTGLLPISSGVACLQYGENTYPNIAHFYPDGVVINPYKTPVWNQRVMTLSYGFKRMLRPRGLLNETDSIVMARAQAYLERASEPTAVLALTIDMHTPFSTVRGNDPIDSSLTPMEQAYLRSARYTDRQIGRFLDWADTASVMRNATIVITADHNHFPREEGKGFCPLILSSPRITAPVRVEEAYQMDIYPTVLHSIGQRNYEWQGFGIDLLQTPPAIRTISPREAYAISDKLIRTNYFAK